jgi:DNA-binding MarR family transcriptional regulator/GNAT superfamily N-acetyltransferase
VTSLHDYGGLLLASRLKKVSEALYTGVDDIYRKHGVSLPSRCFPILFLLRDNGPLGITELADRLGQSHPAVSQMSRKLLHHGVVREQAHAGDNRRRLLVLAPKGAAMMKRMGPVWTAISAAVDQLNTMTHVDFVAAVTTLDGALGERPFARRIDASLRQRDARHVAIIPFESRHGADFKRLNVEWLEKYFTVEPIDEKVLSHPEAAILRPGGRIFLARFKREIVGTAALIKAGRGRYELSKMAVTERYQGLHIGQRLLTAAIAEFHRMKGRELFLESNSALTPALRLYAANGFVHAPRPDGSSHYKRSDVYMVYCPADASR